MSNLILAITVQYQEARQWKTVTNYSDFNVNTQTVLQFIENFNEHYHLEADPTKWWFASNHCNYGPQTKLSATQLKPGCTVQLIRSDLPVECWEE